VNTVYWASCALMWIVALFAAGTLAFYTRKLRAAIRGTQASNPDRALAQWCRKTNLTVVTVNGTEFTITLADLAVHSNPTREWNVPVSVAIWSTLAAPDTAHA
jgi:uncharacterized membrane protein